MNHIIYTDGACSGNPGKGSWAAIIIDQKNHHSEISGFDGDTTNNRMELMAVIKALEFLKNHSEISLYTDSKYVMDGITSWIQQWKKNGWRTASKKPVKNQDLWILLDELRSKHTVQWNWVKGHSGNEMNEKVDLLCQQQLLQKIPISIYPSKP